jgi:pantoate--beta-alanine ligase
MRTITRGDDLHTLVAGFRRDGRRIALVPTMGNLHAGHHSLIDIARARADVVIASLFVNPTQFGPHEDFTRYPRTPEADAAGLAACGCDVLFMPAVEEMYPFGATHAVTVGVPGLRDVLEGAIRPGHFDGVASVVARLFNFAQPQVAVFGQKDYQQLLVIRRMTRDLGYPIQIVAAPIVREASGLAMSSRNRYLDAGERERAAVIHAALQAMRDGVLHSTLPLAAIEARAAEQLVQVGLVPDYAVLRRADDLGEAPDGRRDGLIALVAARSGTTRLIDNLICA